MTRYSTGICANCGKKKEEHVFPFPHNCPMNMYGVITTVHNEPGMQFEDSGDKQVRDNAHRVLEAAQVVLSQWRAFVTIRDYDVKLMAQDILADNIIALEAAIKDSTPKNKES